jgi:pimeloyl-ACP methyl ester carboxylesterase
MPRDAGWTRPEPVSGGRVLAHSPEGSEHRGMALAPANGIELEYETFGDASDPPVLLVMGLGAQLVAWDPEFCQRLVDRGLFVIRFDNRDVGLSTHLSDAPPIDLMQVFTAALSGQEVEVPYRLDDMADDAFGLLDHLGIDSAHVVGVSMGGMIGQTMAILRPERVRTLTSIMSSTGDRNVGGSTPEATALLLTPPPSEREKYVEYRVGTSRLLNGSVRPFDEDRARRRAGQSFDRCFDPPGVGRQLAAIIASGDRTAALASVECPTLVVHGDVDPLVDHSGGVATAKAVPGAELCTVAGMGHDLPESTWDEVVGAIAALVHGRGA